MANNNIQKTKVFRGKMFMTGKEVDEYLKKIEKRLIHENREAAKEAEEKANIEYKIHKWFSCIIPDAPQEEELQMCSRVTWTHPL
jgi:hypothetical protein